MSNKLKKMKKNNERLKPDADPLRQAAQQVVNPKVASPVLQQLVDPKQLEFQKVYHELMSQNQNKIKEINNSIPAEKLKNLQGRIVINYIADRNGCGYYRAIWPSELMATLRNIMTVNTFVYTLEPSTLTNTHCLRFQRQATDSQKAAWDRYLSIKQQYGFNYKLQYEIDDLLMEIMPSNKIAYDFFDDQKKRNHMYMLHTSDSITFSTEPLRDIYVKDYGVDPSKIRVVKNHLPQFLYSLPLRNTVKEFNKEKKPRIFWSGSASHIGSDLNIILPLIEKTVDEYHWVLQGVFPPELTEYVKAGKIEFVPWSPVYGLANIQFYRCRPDICLAPLVPCRFNSVKSDLKYLESCALGAPCICTSFTSKGLKSPYDLANAEICLDPDPDAWKATIDHLISNPDYYMEVVKNQYKFLNGRWMENNIDEWIQGIM